MLSKEEFLELATAKYDNVKKLQEIKNFYDYEKTFDEIWTDYGREILEKSISETPKDRRKKNLCRYGKIEISNSHPFSNLVNGYKISPYMQEKIVLVGQNDCYGVGSEMLSNLLSVEVNSMQLHRVTNTYGNLLEDEKVLNVHAIEEDSLGINKEE